MAVVAGAVVLASAGPWRFGWSADTTAMRVMTFLVVASPCALVLSTMPATLAALAVAARRGVLGRGGAVLEQFADVDVAAFDKTGTLTTGRPVLTSVTPVPGIDPDELLTVAAAAERWSEHPIGRAIVDAAARRGLAVPIADGVEVLASRGVLAVVAGRRVSVGGAALLGEGFQVGHGDDGERGTVVGVEIDGAPAGTMRLADRVRAESE